MSKNLEVIQGDTLTLGFRVSTTNGVVDFTLPDTKIYAHITDLSGRRVVARFKIQPEDLTVGQFRIHLDSRTSQALRGKHLWSVRYERPDRTVTLAGGELVVKASM